MGRSGHQWNQTIDESVVVQTTQRLIHIQSHCCCSSHKQPLLETYNNTAAAPEIKSSGELHREIYANTKALGAQRNIRKD